MDQSAPASRFRIGPELILDLRERRLTRGELVISISPRAFDLLAHLCRIEGALASKDQLLDVVWQGAFVEEGTIARHVWAVRRALGADAALLENVPRSGYRLHQVRADIDRPGSPGPDEVPAMAALERPRRWPWHVLAAAALVLLIGWGLGQRGPAPPVPSSAQELGRRADALTARRSEADVTEAVQLYRQALELDPGDPVLHAGMATSLSLLAGTVFPAEAHESARRHAQRALELDPTNADAMAVLGLVAMNYDHAWDIAEDWYRQALDAAPDHARTHHWLGEMLVLLGQRQAEGLRLLERAHELVPDSVVVASDLAKAAYFSRQFERAAEAGTAAIRLDPVFPHAYRWRGFALVELRRCTDAASDLRNAVRLDLSTVVRAELANVLGRCGEVESARALVAELEREAQSAYVSPLSLLVARAGAGDHEGALIALEDLAGAPNMVLGITTAACLDDLRSYPRFTQLERQIFARNRRDSVPQ